MTYDEALKIADEKELDLISINSNVLPNIFKLMNTDKHRFELQKKEKEKKVKQKQRIIELKEVRFTPVIGDKDYQTKVKQIIHFLEKGKKVKVSIRFKGRMITHKEVGEKVINQLMKDIESNAEIESKPKFEGKQLWLILRAKQLI